MDAIQSAWDKSLPYDPILQHEEGGWIYYSSKEDLFIVDPWPSGKPRADPIGHPDEILTIAPSPAKPPEGYAVIAQFHTHPPKFELFSGKICDLKRRPSIADNAGVEKIPKQGLIITAPDLPDDFTPLEPGGPFDPSVWYPFPYKFDPKMPKPIAPKSK